MKPTVKVWPMPKLTQPQFKELFARIVSTCVKIELLRVKDKNGIVVVFPQDAMGFGPGTDLVIEIGIPHAVLVNQAEATRITIAIQIGQTVKEFFNRNGFKPVIQCQPHTIFGVDLF